MCIHQRGLRIRCKSIMSPPISSNDDDQFLGEDQVSSQLSTAILPHTETFVCADTSHRQNLYGPGSSDSRSTLSCSFTDMQAGEKRRSATGSEIVVGIAVHQGSKVKTDNSGPAPLNGRPAGRKSRVPTAFQKSHSASARVLSSEAVAVIPLVTRSTCFWSEELTASQASRSLSDSTIRTRAWLKHFAQIMKMFFALSSDTNSTRPSAQRTMAVTCTP